MEETLEQLQARHRKELRDLQSRITSKKKNATKKTRKGVNDECAQLELQTRQRHQDEIRKLNGEPTSDELTSGGGGEGKEEEEGDDGDDGSQVRNARETQVNGLVDGLQSASLDDGAPSTQQQQQQQPQQPQAKKRNRQKDRIARRAAEQEAALAAAEAEAASMTDRRGGERTNMEAEFRARSLVEREIRPDGHCLFAAVADQLGELGVLRERAEGGEGSSGGGGGEGGGEPPYRAVRKVAAAYMQAHADDFAGFMEEPLGSYVAKMRDTAEWGGQLELAALASAYGVDIQVVRDGGVEVINPSGAAGAKEDRKTIWLAYYRHTYGLGEHYNSLRHAVRT